MTSILLDMLDDGETNFNVACARCGRRGSYNIEFLLSEYGELSPTSLMERLTLGCERSIAKNPLDPCSAIYAGFEILPHARPMNSGGQARGAR